METLPICKAKSKRSGQRCKNFAVKGKKVCHIHGGLSTGARTPEGKFKQKMASWKTGQHSAEAKAERRAFRSMLKQYEGTIEELF